MEEKERYKYREVSNEVEHYECYWDNKEVCELFDDETVLNRLNEQDFELKKLNQENINLIEENQQLKQQLAEKDKEIEYYKKQVKKFNNEAQKYFEDAYCNDFHNQDKISFCIEQLEKVKEHNDNLVCDDEDYSNYITAFIDNQIKQLKEGKAENEL